LSGGGFLAAQALNESSTDSGERPFSQRMRRRDRHVERIAIQVGGE
jgi:hypothetical protein